MKTYLFKRTCLLLFTVAFFYSCSEKEKNNTTASSDNSALPVDITIAKSDNYSQNEIVAGSIIANRFVEINSELSKKINSVNFKDGSTVKMGTVLYKLEDGDIKAKIQQLQAELDLASLNEQRLASLLKTESVRREEHDIAVAKKNALLAHKQLLQDELSKTFIRAPFDGIVGISKVFTGSYVTPGNSLTTIQEQRILKLQFHVSEKYVTLLKPGMIVSFTTVDRNDKLKATVVSTDVALSNDTRSILVHALISNTNGHLRPGMSAKVFFATNKTDRIGFSVPTEAVVPSEKGYSVFLFSKGTAKLQPVEIIDRTDNDVLIKSGIKQGDSILISNLLRVSNGMPVQIASIKQ